MKKICFFYLLFTLSLSIPTEVMAQEKDKAPGLQKFIQRVTAKAMANDAKALESIYQLPKRYAKYIPLSRWTSNVIQDLSHQTSELFFNFLPYQPIPQRYKIGKCLWKHKLPQGKRLLIDLSGVHDFSTNPTIRAQEERFQEKAQNLLIKTADISTLWKLGLWQAWGVPVFYGDIDGPFSAFQLLSSLSFQSPDYLEPLEDIYKHYSLDDIAKSYHLEHTSPIKAPQIRQAIWQKLLNKGDMLSAYLIGTDCEWAGLAESRNSMGPFSYAMIRAFEGFGAEMTRTEQESELDKYHQNPPNAHPTQESVDAYVKGLSCFKRILKRQELSPQLFDLGMTFLYRLHVGFGRGAIPHKPVVSLLQKLIKDEESLTKQVGKENAHAFLASAYKTLANYASAKKCVKGPLPPEAHYAWTKKEVNWLIKGRVYGNKECMEKLKCQLYLAQFEKSPVLLESLFSKRSLIRQLNKLDPSFLGVVQEKCSSLAWNYARQQAMSQLPEERLAYEKEGIKWMTIGALYAAPNCLISLKDTLASKETAKEKDAFLARLISNRPLCNQLRKFCKIDPVAKKHPEESIARRTLSRELISQMMFEEDK